MKQVIKQQSTEKIAEDYISIKLLSSDIIPAKPKLDINGADLLAILEVEDGSKFAAFNAKVEFYLNLNHHLLCLWKNHMSKELLHVCFTSNI